ncbi:MAG: FUSC family protein [Chitinophagaceae bacterium]|nr:FUSC family protein [Chitinophagaceae bacterium]
MTLKDYQAELRKFVSGQYLYTGFRVTACVIVPAWLLYHFGLLGTMVSFPLGALFVGLTDNPGPVHHRRNGLLISSALNFIVVLVAGLSRSNPWLIGLEIIFFGFSCSLISVFGTRASSIGLTALIIFIISTNKIITGDVLYIAFYYLLGGLWYTVISLSLTSLRPYRPVQQILGECLMKISSYLSAKALFYRKDVNWQQVLPELIDRQIDIHQYQEQLRSMLFTTRRFLSESTHKGRILTMMFRESIDLFERAVATHHDYKLLHDEFDGTGVLETFQRSINSMAIVLYNTGLAVQEGGAYRDEAAVKKAMEESTDAFAKIRSEKMVSANVESFIRLRHILYSLQNLADILNRIMLYTTYEKSLSTQFKNDVDLSKFPTKQKINFNLLISNISFNSSAFRHAMRLTLALLIGYFVSLFFSVGHGYWILLTIATIIKPAYSLSKQRNIQRLAGTFAGVVIGFLVLYLSHNNTVIFLVMIFTMIIAYSLLKVNYAVSIAGITIYLLLSFHFLYPQGLTILLADRIIDTIIGCVIAYVISYFVLPAWEYQQIDKMMRSSIEAQRKYFNAVAGAFTGNQLSPTAFKIARKEAFVTLANFSDTFQRMLSDPKSHQPGMPLYHQFISADYLLASHIASLSDYAQKYGSIYNDKEFQSLINLVDKTFDGNNNVTDDLQSTPVYRRVKRLLDQRKKDIENAGLEGTPEEKRKTLSELVRITDQFRVIYSTAKEAVKIAGEIKKGGPGLTNTAS